MWGFGKKRVTPLKKKSLTERKSNGYVTERKSIDARYTDPSDRWAHEAAWSELDSRHSRFGKYDIRYLLKFK